MLSTKLSQPIDSRTLVASAKYVTRASCLNLSYTLTAHWVCSARLLSFCWWTFGASWKYTFVDEFPLSNLTAVDNFAQYILSLIFNFDYFSFCTHTYIIVTLYLLIYTFSTIYLYFLLLSYLHLCLPSSNDQSIIDCRHMGWIFTKDVAVDSITIFFKK